DIDIIMAFRHRIRDAGQVLEAIKVLTHGVNILHAAIGLKRELARAERRVIEDDLGGDEKFCRRGGDTDTLTGLPNQRCCVEEIVGLTRAINNIRLADAGSVAVLGAFAKFGEQEMADHMLQALAETLRHVLSREVFVGYHGSGYFVVASADSAKVLEDCLYQVWKQCSNKSFSFAYGIAETNTKAKLDENQIFLQARRLMLENFEKNRSCYSNDIKLIAV
ncbi:hypothetical protein ACFL2B_03265, partial [Patescibacteria group bacterium]